MKLKKLIKKDIIIAAATIFILIIAISFASYSLFFKVKETNQDTITYGDLEVSFEQNNSTISRLSDSPKTATEGMETEPFTFTIKNTGSLKAKYTVIVDDDNNYIQENNLTKTEDKYIRYAVNSSSVRLVSDIVNNELISGSLEPQDEVTYNLRFWLKEDAPNSVLGTSVVKKVKVKSEYIPDSSSES